MAMTNRTLTILIALAMHLSAFCQTGDEYIFSQLSVNDGLPQNTINAAVQDDDGTMWIATSGGLARYDSYSFEVFHPDNRQTGHIASDATTTLAKDSKGRIWIGTDRGLSLYDKRQGTFRNFTLMGKPVNDIVEIDPTHLLVNTGGALAMFNTSDFKFRKLGLCRLRILSHDITELFRHGNMIYIGCQLGVLQYDITNKQLTRLHIDELEGNPGLTIFRSTPNTLYIGTEGNGLFCIDITTQQHRHITTHNSPLPSDYVRTINADDNGNIWVGTIGGLCLIDQDRTLHRIDSNGNAAKASARCITRDTQGGVWIGTFFNGIYYYNQRKNHFANIRNIPGTNSLSNNIIGCITEDAKGNMWIGTNGGLHLYDRRTARFSLYDTSNGLLSNDIKALYIDRSDNTIYIGSQLGGLGIRKPNGSITSARMNSHTADDNSIYAIRKLDNGHLLLGTLTGLKLFDKHNATISELPQDIRGDYTFPKRIRVLTTDHYGHLWIGGEDGAAVYTMGNGTLRRLSLPKAFDALATACVFAMFEDHAHNIWIGTSQGLYCATLRPGKLKTLTTADGLPSNAIYGILQDNTHRIWLSTGHGICSYTPSDNTLKYYTTRDGLPANLFMPNAACRTANGTMMFGSISGIASFAPEAFHDNPFTPKALITELRLFDKRVQPGDGTGILEEQIEQTKSITLNHKQTAVSLRLAVPNFLSGTHNTFAYKLEGYDNTWRHATDWQTINYSYLPAGTYRLIVKVANNDGKWNPTPTELQIKVLPPWYATLTAKLIYALMFIGLLYATFRFFIEREREKQRGIQEHNEQQQRQEMYEMRQRFFIDISHELRTPLTLISSPLEEIMAQRTDKATRARLGLIEKNVNRLIHLVNQLMDYRRAELGVFKLKVRNTNVAALLEKTFALYTDKAGKHNIDYTWRCDGNVHDVLCDPNYIELILNNLLSNAFKYTPDGKSITLTAHADADTLTLTVADTGQGIPDEKKEKIFERFYQLDGRHSGGWGIGLSIVTRLVQLHHGTLAVDSQVGQGSTFTIALPSSAQAYGSDEVATGESMTCHDIDNMYSAPDIDTADNDDNTEKDDGESAVRENNDDTTERPCLVVVEDNDDIRHYLAEALADNYRVLEACNGKEALPLIDDNDVSVVLSDVMMPEMDGIELCKRIKGDVRTSHIYVIMLSAKVDVSEQLAGLQVGADDYIPKPFSLMVVKTKIYNILRTRRQMIAGYRKAKTIEPPKITVNSLDEEWVRKAIDIVNEHIADEKFSTDDFAQCMIMSRTSLYMKMKALTGESVKEFIRRIRMNKAAELIAQGQLTIAEISYQVGFATPSYFTTSFKKFFGCLPTEYADRQKD